MTIITFAESPAGMTMAFRTMNMIEICHSFSMRSRNRSLFSLRKHQNRQTED